MARHVAHDGSELELLSKLVYRGMAHPSATAGRTACSFDSSPTVSEAFATKGGLLKRGCQCRNGSRFFIGTDQSSTGRLSSAFRTFSRTHLGPWPTGVHCLEKTGKPEDSKFKVRHPLTVEMKSHSTPKPAPWRPYRQNAARMRRLIGRWPRPRATNPLCERFR